MRLKIKQLLLRTCCKHSRPLPRLFKLAMTVTQHLRPTLPLVKQRALSLSLCGGEEGGGGGGGGGVSGVEVAVEKWGDPSDRDKNNYSFIAE